MSSKADKQLRLIVETYGFDGLEETFNDFQYSDKRKILLAAFRKAVKPTVELAKSNISRFKKSGKLLRSIGTLPLRNEIGILVGARKGGTEEGVFAGYHGHLLNDGTVKRFYITKSGARHETGRMSAAKPYNRWFTKAAFATEAQAVDTVAEEWYKEISKFIRKSNRDRKVN